jgi:hypothetical protein
MIKYLKLKKIDVPIEGEWSTKVFLTFRRITPVLQRSHPTQVPRS